MSWISYLVGRFSGDLHWPVLGDPRGAYDTLLQMGRWFGYRDGYDDLCRLFLSEEAEGWYRHITHATNELKRDFARMRRQKATPEEFGLRVRTHPDTLLITARNKMATGVDVVGETRDISLAGRGIETARLYADKGRNEENLGIVDRFLTDLIAVSGAPVTSPHGGALLWRDVPAGTVGRLLEDFLVHPLNHDFQGDAIATFLREAVERGEAGLSNWTIALPDTGRKGEVALGCGLTVQAKKRRVLVRQMQSLLVSGKGARVGSRADVRHALSADEVLAVTQAQGESDLAEDIYRAEMQCPLLIIYLLRGVEREGKSKEEKGYKSDLVLPALALHFPGVEKPDTKKHYIEYRLNRVAQAELELDGDDLEDEVDDD